MIGKLILPCIYKMQPLIKANISSKGMSYLQPNMVVLFASPFNFLFGSPPKDAPVSKEHLDFAANKVFCTSSCPFFTSHALQRFN